MSFTANTMFEARLNNGEFDSLANITGKFQASSADADCSAGFLCVRASKLGLAGYSSIDNENAWIMNAAGASDYTGIYACNPHGVQMLSAGNGAKYKVGSETLGIGVPSGELDTFTEIDFDGNNKIYRFGTGNLSTTLSTNTYCTIANGQLVPAASAPLAGKPYFKVMGTGTATRGAYAGMGYVDVMACRDINVATQ